MPIHSFGRRVQRDDGDLLRVLRIVSGSHSDSGLELVKRRQLRDEIRCGRVEFAVTARELDRQLQFGRTVDHSAGLPHIKNPSRNMYTFLDQMVAAHLRAEKKEPES